MSYGLKRGFLKGSSSTPKPPSTAEPSKSSTTEPPKSKYADFEAKHSMQVTPGRSIQDFSPQNGRINILVTHLPAHEPARPDVEYAICVLYNGTKDALVARNWPREPKYMSPGYVVQQVTGYGLSMIASRDIAIGELVACERPIVIFPAVLPSTEARMSTIPDTFNQLLTAAVDQKMQPNRRQMFYQLFNCKNTQYRVKDICDTNSFSLGALPGANYHYPYAGVFHDLSRINHSCSPNVTLRWDTETFTMSINAVQPIKAGEQIFLSYDEADLTSPRVIRRRTMSQKFNFKCNCTSCALAAPESKESNQRRAELEAALEQVKKESTAVPRDIKAWVQDKRDEVHRKTVAESSKVMDLMEKENIVLQALCDYHIPRLARAHCSLGNIAEAKEWANKMVGFNKAFTGTGDGWQKIERQLGAL